MKHKIGRGQNATSVIHSVSIDMFSVKTRASRSRDATPSPLLFSRVFASFPFELTRPEAAVRLCIERGIASLQQTNQHDTSLLPYHRSRLSFSWVSLIDPNCCIFLSNQTYSPRPPHFLWYVFYRVGTVAHLYDCPTTQNIGLLVKKAVAYFNKLKRVPGFSTVDLNVFIYAIVLGKKQVCSFSDRIFACKWRCRRTHGKGHSAYPKIGYRY